jgi:predicted nucleotidyltransferase
MHRLSNPNITLLERAVEQLGPLVDEMVFVGGCATGLLLTDTAAPSIRVTQDVDVLTEVATRGEYYRLCARLRARGFSEDQSSGAPLCRWVAADVILDVMPTNPEILGFGNEWYEEALRHSDVVTLPSGSRIRVVTSPYFLATKLAAFEGRGNNDYKDQGVRVDLFNRL